MRRVTEPPAGLARPASTRPPRSPSARRATECRAMTPPCSRPSPPAEGRRHRRMPPPPSRRRAGPAPVGAPPAQRNGRNDERREQEIPERVGEVDGDRRRVALGAALEGRIQERGPDRRDRERTDQPIEPDALLVPVETHVGEQREAGVKRGISADVEEIGSRRVRDLVELCELEVPVDVADRPQPRARGDHQPGGPIVAHEDPPRADRQARRPRSHRRRATR